jgi:hypothetical protein
MEMPTEIKSLRADPENTIDGYVRRRITGSSAIYKASIDILLCHMADFHKMTLAILCKKHGLNLEDVLVEVQEDPAYKEMLTHPLMRTLTYMADEDVDYDVAAAALEPANADADAAKPADAAAAAKPAEPVKKPRRKLKIVHEPAAESKPVTAETTNKEIKIEGTAAPSSQKQTKVIVKKKSSAAAAKAQPSSSE